MNEDKLNQFKDVMASKQSKAQHTIQMQKLDSLEKSLVSSMRQLVQFLDGKTTKTEVVNQLKSINTPDIDKVVKAVEKLDSSVKGGKLDISPLVKGLDALEKQLKQLPKSFPEAPEQLDTIKVSNLADIDIKSLEKAIKGLDLKAPEVNVKPEVNVEAPDLQPLKDSLLDVVKAIKEQPQPEKTDVSGVEKRLDESNKKLQTLIDQPKGGGGGGSGVSYQDSAGRPVRVETESDGSIPVTVVAGGGSSSSGNALSTYALVQDDENATYEYYGYVQADGSWCIKRVTISTNYSEFVTGASNYATAWTNRASQTYADYWSTF